MTALYVSDLDGTLLRDDATLSDFSRNILRELLADGMLFTVATARSVVFVRQALAGLALPLPIIEFNGAFLSDPATGRHEVVHHLDPEILAPIHGLIRDFGGFPFVSTFNGAEDCLYHCEIINAGMAWYLNDRIASRDPRLRAVDDVTCAFRDQVVCLTVIGVEALLQDLRSAVVEAHGAQVVTHFYENRYSRGWYWLTVHDRRATKDQALRALRERCGLYDHPLVVFGDHDNDLLMFQAADRAVAVANATDTLKRHATYVIGTNEEDSVARYLLAERRSPR